MNTKKYSGKQRYQKKKPERFDKSKIIHEPIELHISLLHCYDFSRVRLLQATASLFGICQQVVVFRERENERGIRLINIAKKKANKKRKIKQKNSYAQRLKKQFKIYKVLLSYVFEIICSDISIKLHVVYILRKWTKFTVIYYCCQGLCIQYIFFYCESVNIYQIYDKRYCCQSDHTKHYNVNLFIFCFTNRIS